MAEKIDSKTSVVGQSDLLARYVEDDLGPTLVPRI